MLVSFEREGKKSNRQVIESLTVTSIEEFRDYLRTEAVRFLHEIELNLKKMPFPPHLRDGIILNLSPAKTLIIFILK